MTTDYIDAGQLPMKRRLQREFAKTARKIALDKAPTAIKNQMDKL